jgi:hypothetical protein
VSPTDLVGGPHNSWSPSRRFPRRPYPERLQYLASKTR